MTEAMTRAVILLAGHILAEESHIREVERAPQLLKAIADALQEVMGERDAALERSKGLEVELAEARRAALTRTGLL